MTGRGIVRFELTRNLVPTTDRVGVQMTADRYLSVGDVCVVYPVWMPADAIEIGLAEIVVIREVYVEKDECVVYRGQEGTVPKLFSGAYIRKKEETSLGGSVSSGSGPHTHSLSEITGLGAIVSALDAESKVLSEV